MKFERFGLLSLPLMAAIAGLVIIPAVFAASPSSISVNVVPENPAPFESVSITLNSYANNLDTVLISWFVNGKKTASGTGKKSFSLNAPKAGSETIVLSRIALPEGDLEIKVPVRPGSLTLLWQAVDSYVPPFYKGKALPAPDSEIKVVAMPEITQGGGLLDPKNMTYAWRLDYTNDQESSGYGKNFFFYLNDYLENSNSVSVVASTLDQKSSSEASVNINTTSPKILFYKRDPKMGTLWENSIPENHKIGNNEVIEAAPYFISPKEILSPRLVWSWLINGNGVNTSGFRKNLLPLRVAEGASGTSNLKLQIENLDKIFQSLSKEVNIEF